jgi:hypothetical protein
LEINGKEKLWILFHLAFRKIQLYYIFEQGLIRYLEVNVSHTCVVKFNVNFINPENGKMITSRAFNSIYPQFTRLAMKSVQNVEDLEISIAFDAKTLVFA